MAGLSKGGSKAPAAPDPAATAAAQTATNKETAYWNAVLNNVNQITPYGNLTYAQNPASGKQYNYDAYNKALQSYNTGIQGFSNSQPTNNNAIGGGAGSGSGNATGTYQLPPAPKLSDFMTEETPPSFTSTIELSPEQKAIYDTQTRSQQALATLGEEQLGRIRSSVSSPYSFSGLPDAFSTEDASVASQRGEAALLDRLNPQFSRDEEALRSRLINQGIGQGSEAYNREMDAFGRNVNDARTQAILQGANYGGALQGQALERRNQGINEYNAQRNAPLNEYIGLTSGVQVQNPQFTSQGYQGAQPVDYAGLVNNQYQAQLGQYNAKTAQSNATQSSLFGLGGSLLGAAGSAGGFAPLFAGMLSDINAKENLVHEGYTPGGIRVYSYNYKGSIKRETGVIAQQVEKVIPEAVYTKDGLKHVNYALVR